MINPDDIVKVKLTDEKINEGILDAKNIVESILDRSDLHTRDYLERFIDCLMGEIAEKMVLKWLQDNNKFAKSAVNKQAAKPDIGHDIWLINIKGERIRASIKSSLSALKYTPEDILNTFTIATTLQEVREVNIQIYFWLNSYSTPRVNVPSINNAAIVAWASVEDLHTEGFSSYQGEQRKAPKKKLVGFRPMKELLINLK